LLDDILNSSVFTLVAAVAVAVTAIALQPSPRVESGAVRNLVGTSAPTVAAPRQPLAAAEDPSPPVLQLPKVVVTGCRLAPSEMESMAQTN